MRILSRLVPPARLPLLSLSLAVSLGAQRPAPSVFRVEETTIEQVHAAFKSKQLTCHALVACGRQAAPALPWKAATLSRAQVAFADSRVASTESPYRRSAPSTNALRGRTAGCWIRATPASRRTSRRT